MKNEQINIDYGTYLQLDKYYHLDEAIEEVCPEILEDDEVKMLKDKLRWAEKNLRSKIYSMINW